MKEINKAFLKPLFETSGEMTEWFGYYNYDVISPDGGKMLCNRADFDGRAITADDRLTLGWYDLSSGEFHPIDTTNSFNWQQGAMLQWLPGEGNETKVIYNVARDGHFQSVIADVLTGEKRYVNFPTYCVTPDGKYSVSLNYERSYWCRAYHYQSVVNPAYDVRVAEDDGVFLVDLTTGEVRRIVNIADVIATDPDKDFDSAKHWLEHIMISPGGTRIAFLHRFSFGSAYTTRLFVCDADGGNLQCMPEWRGNDWSHFGWRGEDSFVIYSVKKNAFQAGYAKGVQKAKRGFSPMTLVNRVAHWPILRGLKNRLKPHEKYYKMYEYRNGAFFFTRNLDEKEFGIDGHPSFTADGRYMLTDTYPDAKGMQSLLLHDTVTGKVITLGKFFAHFQGNPASCDLHPKLSFGGRYVAVDTAYSGIHRMSLFQIQWESVKKALS